MLCCHIPIVFPSLKHTSLLSIYMYPFPAVMRSFPPSLSYFKPYSYQIRAHHSKRVLPSPSRPGLVQKAHKAVLMLKGIFIKQLIWVRIIQRWLGGQELLGCLCWVRVGSIFINALTVLIDNKYFAMGGIRSKYNRY